MNIFRPYKNQKTRAQSMVEFALVLPILLVLIYGLLETGRLLFIYASTITAARQAARYGSATGNNPDGIPYFNDCDGIEAAADRVGFINVFDSVTISYDGGLDSLGDSIDLAPPPADPACENFIPTGNGNRIIVEVTAQWSPIVPIVPLKPFVIRSTSERTILTSVDIYVAADPPDFNAAGDGKPYLVSIVPDPTTYNALGQVIHYTYNLRNSGLGDLVNPTIVDNKIIVDCGTITVIPGATFTCTGDYVITQADLDAGSFVNKAYPTGWPANALSAVITATQSAAISLEKSGPVAVAPKVGRSVAYTYKITNSGNVTLNAPFSVADNRISVDCSGATNIAPGSFTTCSGTDEVTEQDISNGRIVNQATASVLFKTTTVQSNMATFTVITPPIILEVTPPPSINAPGEQTYTFRLENNTDYAATGVAISDTKVKIDASCANSIPAQSVITCTGTYKFTQSDIDAASSFESSAVATAAINSPIPQNVFSNSYVSNVEIIRTPALTASLVATPSANPLIAGSTILYTYTLTNSGNVTLNTPTVAVTDGNGIVLNNMTIACSGDIAPLATLDCTGTYPILTADMTAGSITITGTASAKFSDGTAPDPDDIQAAPITLTTPTYNGPRFNITAAQDKTIVTPDNLTLKYTYTLTNTGSIVLSRPYTITFTQKSTPIGGGSATTITVNLDSYLNCIKDNIAAGESTECTYTYNHPSGADSLAIVNTITAASIGGTPATSLPAPLSATVYNCTNTNFTVVYNPPAKNSYYGEFVITNNVGLPLTASNVQIGWSGSNTLEEVTVSNSGLSTRGALTDNVSPYNLSGNLNTGVTTIRLTFKSKEPALNLENITISSPYGTCSR